MPEQMTLEQAVHAIRKKFTSGNSVPVERATITTMEWAAIDAHLNAAKGEAVAFLIEDKNGKKWAVVWHKNTANAIAEIGAKVTPLYTNPLADAEDARRYRWLRDVGDATWTALIKRMPYYNIDKAIDDAMAAREGGE